MNETMYVCGIDSKDYRIVHHLGSAEFVRNTYDSLQRGAKANGLSISSIFIVPYPVPPEYELDKFNPDFLEWLNKECELILDK